MSVRVSALAICLVVASCATSPGAEPSPCPVPDVAAAGERLGLSGSALAVAAHDNYFEPACAVVPAGSELTIVVTNKGRYPHDLTLADGKGVRLDGGQTAFLDLRTDTESIRFVCTIHPGMEGELQVSDR